MAEDKKSTLDDENTDFYDEFKDRMRQEPLRSVLSQKSQPSKPLGGIVTVLLGVFLGALVLWYIIGKYFIANDNIESVEAPIITADIDPVKDRPDNVGGMEILGKDKSVYDRLSDDNEGTSEKIISRIEDPIPLPAPSEPEVVEEVKIGVKANNTNIENVQVVNPSLPKVLENLPLEKKEPEKLVTNDVIKEVKTETEVVVKAKEEIKQVNQTAKVEAKPAVVEKIKTVSKNTWKVQILSSRDEAGVIKSWERLKGTHKDLLNDVAYEIIAADLGAKGTFYRLRVGSFEERKMADDLCSKLKSRKLDCFVVK